MVIVKRIDTYHRIYCYGFLELTDLLLIKIHFIEWKVFFCVSCTFLFQYIVVLFNTLKIGFKWVHFRKTIGKHWFITLRSLLKFNIFGVQSFHGKFVLNNIPLMLYQSVILNFMIMMGNCKCDIDMLVGICLYINKCCSQYSLESTTELNIYLNFMFVTQPTGCIH